MNLNELLTIDQQVKAHKMVAHIQRHFLNNPGTKFICCHIEDYCRGLRPYEDADITDDSDMVVIESVLLGYIQNELIAGAYTVMGYLEDLFNACVTEDECYQYRLKMLERLLKELA